MDRYLDRVGLAWIVCTVLHVVVCKVFGQWCICKQQQEVEKTAQPGERKKKKKKKKKKKRTTTDSYFYLVGILSQVNHKGLHHG